MKDQKMINVRIPADLAEKFNQTAQERAVNKSEFLRQCIEEFCRNGHEEKS